MRSEAAAAGRHVVCNLLNAEETAATLRRLTPDIVIHAQAMSDVDRCELEPQLAQEQNVRTIEHVTRGLSGGRVLLVFVSTDYVFDGTKGSPYDEADAPHPISIYGASKLEAERVVGRYPKSVVVRTSTLFGPGRSNFCDHLVSQLRSGQPVEAFIDQTTSPTYTEDLAVGIAELSLGLQRSWHEAPPRMYHLVNAGGASRVAFARRVAQLLGAPDELVRAIPMATQHRPARRPPYSALISRHVGTVTGRTLRPWDDALHAYLRQQGWIN